MAEAKLDSVFTFLGWPEAVQAAVFLVGAAIAISPWLGGRDVGNLKVPGPVFKAAVKNVAVGAAIFFAAILMAIPGTFIDRQPFWREWSLRAQQMARQEAETTAKETEALAKAAELAVSCMLPAAAVPVSNVNLIASSGGSLDPSARIYTHTDESSRCRVSFSAVWRPLDDFVFIRSGTEDLTRTEFYYKENRFGFDNNTPLYTPVIDAGRLLSAWSEIKVEGTARGNSGTSDDTCGGKVVLTALQVPLECLPHLLP